MSGRTAASVLAVFAAALVAYYFLTAPGLFGSKAQGDGLFGFHYLPNLVVHHSLDMRHSLPEHLDTMDTGARGHKLNRAPIGPALAMLPVYCLVESAKLVGGCVARACGRAPVGLGPPAFVPHTGQMLYTGLVTLAAGLCGMLLTYALLRRYFGRGAALLGALTAIALTPQLWYLTIQPHYQHGLAFAAVALLLWRWDGRRGTLTLRRFGELGVLGGVAMLMRAQEVVFLLAPAGELAMAALRRPRASGRRVLGCAALLGLGALLGFLPQLVVWGRYFGWLVRPTNIERMRPLEPALAAVLWSLRAGLFPWTPAAYLGVLGLGLGLVRPMPRPMPAPASGPVAAPADVRGLLAAALLIGLADVYLVAASWVWYGGFSFGARRLSDLAGVFGAGVAVLWTQAAAVPKRLGRAGRAALLLGLVFLSALNLTLVELVRRRRLPDSGAAAQPAFQLAQRAGGPSWLISLLRYGYPFAQPAGLLFALRHHAPLTAWEGVVGNYALEREAHDLSVRGATWDFRGPEAEQFVVEGLLPAPADVRGRPVGPRVRILLQPFARTAIAATLYGALPADGVTVAWNGQPLAAQTDGTRTRFTIPAAQVHAHAVGELTLQFQLPAGAPAARLRQLELTAPLP